MTATHVLINGRKYIPEDIHPQKEILKLLSEVYAVLWAEAFYDPFNESTKKFATPLAEKMMIINTELCFRE
jgi:hypothetical protein